MPTDGATTAAAQAAAALGAPKQRNRFLRKRVCKSGHSFSCAGYKTMKARIMQWQRRNDSQTLGNVV